MKSNITTRELTHIAFMGCLLFCVFQAFASILYLEMITFTVIVFCMLFPRRDAILACGIFAMMNMLIMGITPWTFAYLLIYTAYAALLTTLKNHLLKHRFLLYCICGILSFLTGILLDLPFLLFSDKVTMLYMLMGLKTSLIQGAISFTVAMFLFDSVYQKLALILRKDESICQ